MLLNTVQPLIEFYNPHSFSAVLRNYGDYKILGKRLQEIASSFEKLVFSGEHVALIAHEKRVKSNTVRPLIEFYNPHSFSAVLRNYGDYKILGKKLRSVPKR